MKFLTVLTSMSVVLALIYGIQNILLFNFLHQYSRRIPTSTRLPVYGLEEVYILNKN